MYQGSFEEAAGLCEDHRSRLGIEIRQAIVLLENRRRELVPHAQIEGQFRVDFPIILKKAKVHVLMLIEYGKRCQRQLSRQAQQEIADGAVGETVVKIHAADGRIQVIDAGLRVQEFATELQG